jgi:hypothetical protein
MTVATAQWTFDAPVPWELPDQNSRGHWAKRARMVALARQGFGLAAKSEMNKLTAPKAAERRWLQITLFRGSGAGGRRLPLLDQAQLVGKLKPLVDALKDVGWIYNDNPKWLDERLPRQEQSRGLPWVRVEIGIDG